MKHTILLYISVLIYQKEHAFFDILRISRPIFFKNSGKIYKFVRFVMRAWLFPATLQYARGDFI